MKVRLLVSLGEADRAYNVGDIYECKDHEAANLLREGFAELIQTTTRSAPERAVKPKARRRRG